MEKVPKKISKVMHENVSNRIYIKEHKRNLGEKVQSMNQNVTRDIQKRTHIKIINY